MEDLSPRQKDVLDVIVSTIDQRGYPPTYREIGDQLGIRSTNGVADHVKALIKKGYLHKPSGGAARVLQLMPKARMEREDAVVTVPLVGRVAAGQPILADEAYERSIKLDRSLIRSGGNVFALRVRGDSMIEEGIFEGDLVIVQQETDIRDGDVVVALIDGEATVKFFFRERGHVRLEPAHPTMPPIIVDDTHDLAILGRVIGVWREL